MEAKSVLLILVIVWLTAVVFIIRHHFRKRTASAGLSAAFVLTFSLEHWFGGVIYSLPWYTSYDFKLVMSGFKYSLYALIAFAFGNIVFAPFLVRAFSVSRINETPYIANPKLPRVYFLIGIFFYFGLQPLLSRVASMRTLAYLGWYIIVVGICLNCWKAWCLKKKRALTYWLLFAGIMPFFTMLTSGFLAIGTMTLITILCFVSVFYRPKWRVVLIGFVAVYLGLSFFVSYMEYREELRKVVWGQKGMSKRMDVFFRMMNNFEFLDLNKDAHLDYINVRLNQNYLVGAAVDHMQVGREKYARGQTILQFIPAIVPRIIWPEKPIVLGGADLVNKYTGIEFAESVSVPMGLVMEFYVNFATTGIVVGFIMLGTAIAIIDRACGYKLLQGDWRGFAFLFMVAISLVAGNSVVHISMTMAAAIVMCIIVEKFILPQLKLNVKVKKGPR